MPTVLGWSWAGCRRRSSPTVRASAAARAVLARARSRCADAPTAGASGGARQQSAAGDALREAASWTGIGRKIAPSPAGAGRGPARSRCGISLRRWGTMRADEVVELLAARARVRDAGARRSRADRRTSPCRASSSPGRLVFREGDAATRATSCATATRARSARTATGARSRSRPSARATSSASSRCSRTSAARPPSRRSSRRASWRARGGHAPADGRAPAHRDRAS